MRSFGAQAIVVLGIQQLVHWALTSFTGWQSQIGPSALIASSFISFFRDVPALQRFKIMGIPATDKVRSHSSFVSLQKLKASRLLQGMSWRHAERDILGDISIGAFVRFVHRDFCDIAADLHLKIPCPLKTV